METNNWAYNLASEFKARDNDTTKIGPCLGKVVSISPAIISIQNGKYMIQGDQLYVSYHLLERQTTYRELVGSMNGSINIDCHPCGGSYQGSITSSGHIHLDEVWKIGDLVLVVPSESGQQFFVVDVVRPINGCNQQAE